MTQETRLSFVKQADELLPPQAVLEVYKAQADYMVKAGLLPPGYRNGSDVLVVALRGREMGVPFWRSINGMFPMRGRIGFMGTFALGMVSERMPDAEISVVESTAEKCILHVHRPNWSKDRFEDVEVTHQEAHAAHWDENWDKDLKKFAPKATWADRRNMLYWRAVTRAINRYFEDVLGGACYTADEIADIPEEPRVDRAADESSAAWQAPYVTAAQVAMGNGKPPIDVKATPSDGSVGAAPTDPAPPDYDEHGHRIDEHGNPIPDDNVQVPQSEIPFPGPGEVQVPAPASWTEVQPAPAAQASLAVDHVRVAKFAGAASKCQDRKSLDVIFEDYKKGAGPATLSALFNVKKDRASKFAPAPKPTR